MPRAPSPLNLPCPLEAVTTPVTGAPARNIVVPRTTTDWARVPPKLSPTLFSFALTVCPMRTTIGVPEGTVIGLGAGGGAGVIAMAGAGGGAGTAGGAAAGAGAGAAGSAAAGAGAAGAGAAGGVDWAVSVAGAGVLLHPPRSSKPAKDNVLSRTW